MPSVHLRRQLPKQKPRRQTQSKLSEQKCLLMVSAQNVSLNLNLQLFLITNIELSNCYKASLIISASPSILHLIVFDHLWNIFKIAKKFFQLFHRLQRNFQHLTFFFKINSWTGFTKRLNNDAVVFFWYLTLYLISFGESWKNHE